MDIGIKKVHKGTNKLDNFETDCKALMTAMRI